MPDSCRRVPGIQYLDAERMERINWRQFGTDAAHSPGDTVDDMTH